MSTTVQVKNSTKHIQLICVTGLFAAMIYVLTAWLHIPTGAGYTHAGDGLIYLAASMLPTPYAMAAGAIGALRRPCCTWSTAAMKMPTSETRMRRLMKR